MSAAEVRAGASLAGVFGLRMFGLFLILPVLSVHAAKLTGGDNLSLVGTALGIYGLAQGFLQIPFGMASDRWGRKRILYVGLTVFALGSFVGIGATDIWTVILARTLQGAGAISSVAMALAADLTRDQHRTKIMAMIGSTIGLTFAVSLIGAPLLYEWIGMSGLFALTGVMCLAAIALVKFLVPDPSAPVASRKGDGATLQAIIAPELLRLNLGIFILHIVLYGMFVVVPPMLVVAGLPLAEHWKLYLPAVLGSFVLMIPVILYADRRNHPKHALIGGVALLCAVEAVLGVSRSGLVGVGALMLAFFVAFNVLEALLPSLVSRIAPAQGRGVAIGVYNTTQTIGVFVGGVLGGWLAARFGPHAVFLTCAVLCGVWLVAAFGMRPPTRAVNDLSSLTFSIASGVNLEGLREALAAVRGVREAEVLAQERIARLKVVPGQWDESSVRKLVTGEV
jgi:MFS family permease